MGNEGTFKTLGKAINTIAGKVASRKLTVWVAATVAFFMDKIGGDMWAYLSMVYLASQATLDYLLKEKKDS